jgi:hypothetical protein
MAQIWVLHNSWADDVKTESFCKVRSRDPTVLVIELAQDRSCAEVYALAYPECRRETLPDTSELLRGVALMIGFLCFLAKRRKDDLCS